MTVLSSLNIVQSDTASLRVRGIVSMRQKLLDRIADQIALAEAQGSGQSFQRVKFRRVRDLENNEVSEIPVRTRVRPWWIQDKDGSVLAWVKYGNQTLELQKGKTAIRIKSRDDLVKTFQTVSEAVRSGELDDLINGAVSAFKSRFSK
jgi:hypothetical protein